MMPDVPCLQYFFKQFDAYKDRVFELWELKYIFPRLHDDCWKILHEENKRTASLMVNQVSLMYLVNKIETAEPNRYSMRFNPDPESVYVKAQVDQDLTKTLVQLSKQRDVSYDCGNAWDRFGMQTIDQTKLNDILTGWDIRL